MLPLLVFSLALAPALAGSNDHDSLSNNNTQWDIQSPIDWVAVQTAASNRRSTWELGIGAHVRALPFLAIDMGYRAHTRRDGTSSVGRQPTWGL